MRDLRRVVRPRRLRRQHFQHCAASDHTSAGRPRLPDDFGAISRGCHGAAVVAVGGHQVLLQRLAGAEIGELAHAVGVDEDVRP